VELAVQSDATSPWSIPEPPPTTLIVAWPDDGSRRGGEPVGRDEVIARFADAAGEAIEHRELPIPDERVTWGSMIIVPSLDREIIIWVEAGRPIPPDLAGGERLAQTRWIVGLETILDVERPVESWSALMRLCRGAAPAAPLILDVNSTRIHAAEALF
jgi:hypothetical protein